MTTGEDRAELLTERLQDIDRWVTANPDHELAEAIRRMPPVHPSEVAAVEARIRAVDPTGLPERCDVCSRRLPMIQRADGRHPKCTPPATLKENAA